MAGYSGCESRSERPWLAARSDAHVSGAARSENDLEIEKKSDSRAVLFEWLDTLGVNLDLNDPGWLLEATRMYLERRDPKTNWDEVFEGANTIRRSSRITESWERGGTRLFLAPNLYGEAILIQYLVSRSHTHGGLTLEGRITLMELIRRLRYFGYLEHVGITERDPGEVIEKLIDHLAAKREWYLVSTGSGSDRVKRATKKSQKAAKKSAKKSSKKKSSAPP